jgi:hypothetical protein
MVSEAKTKLAAIFQKEIPKIVFNKSIENFLVQDSFEICVFLANNDAVV